MDFLALAEKFVSAIERADVDVIRQCYASDARIWHNFDNIEQTVEQNLATLAWMVLPSRRSLRS